MSPQLSPNNSSHRMGPCARLVSEQEPASKNAWACQFIPVDEATLPPDERDYVEKVRTEIPGMKVGRLGEDLYAYTTEDEWGPLKFKLPFPLAPRRAGGPGV